MKKYFFIISFLLLCFIALCSCDTSESYDNGYDDGYEVGYDDGYEVGYDDGYLVDCTITPDTTLYAIAVVNGIVYSTTFVVE